MMRTLLLCCLCVLACWSVKAQDTLWVKQKEGKPYLVHKVKNGEDLFLLAKKYAVPPAVLADLNDVNYQDGLPAGTKFRIPIDNYNFVRIESVVKSRPIYYRAGEEDDLRGISRLVNVAQSAIQRWNNLVTPDIEAGDVLQIGWIAYDKTQVAFANAGTTTTVAAPVSTPAKPPVTKPLPSAKKPAPVSTPPQATPTDDDDTLAEVSAFAQLYDQQTSGNTNFSEEQGAAVFYPLKTKVGPGVYYAFHNTAPRGSILKIMNPASGKIIFAKVIGPLPNLKEYHNAVVGLSNNVIGALGATDLRMFCKIKYR